MRGLPPEIVNLLNCALVSELTVVNRRGAPVSYPLIPLYDGRHIYMTSSVLFSRKLEHIKANPRVSLSITDPVAADVQPFHGVTIQGEARVIEDDLHSGWEKILPLWIEKEPIIESLVKKRFAMPLFWERALIEITPRRAYLWDGGDTSKPPRVYELAEAA